MIRNVIRLLVVVTMSTLAACASSEKSSEDQGAGGSDTTTFEKETAATKPAAASAAPPDTPAAKVPTPLQTTSALNDAYKKGDDETMQRVASALLAQNPADPKALHALGLINYKRNRYQAAMYYFNRALQHNPNMGEVYTNIGLTQIALDERRDAIRSFKKALELNSNDGAAAANLGSIYALEGDYAKAQIALDRAIKTGVKDARIYNNYGIALTGLGKFEDANEIYREAVKLDPNNRDTLFNLAILQIDHLKDQSGGLETINQLRFLGLADGMRDRINALENKAKAGSNK